MYGQLNIRSHYTLLSGVLKIIDIINLAKQNKCSSIALLDTNNMYGTIEIMKMAKRENINLLIGVSLLFDQGNSVNNRINLIAKNKKGYLNLMKLVTIVQKNKTFSLSENSNNCSNLIAILPSFNNTLQGVNDNNTKSIFNSIELHRKCFGNDIYMGLSNIENNENLLNIQSKNIQISKDNNIPLVANHPIYYNSKNDGNIRKILLNIRNKEKHIIEDEFFVEEDFSFPDTNSMFSKFSQFNGALDNIKTISDSASFTLELAVDTHKWIFPSIEVVGKDHNKDFDDVISAGLKKRGLKNEGKIKTRIDFEKDIITKKGYVIYFLIMQRIINFCQEKEITSGARGSVCGSMIAYIFGITHVNPLKYKISFERFLNPYRPSPPDIDLDVSDTRRGEVVKYICEKFGNENVGQIITFGSLLARASVRDTARALGYSYMTGDRIARLIPLPKQGVPVSIDDSVKGIKELSLLYQNDTDVRSIIDTSKKIEGNARHYSIHAAGIIVSPTPLIEYTPIQYEENGTAVTQYEMHSIGEDGLGLTKIDILGLSYLAVLEDSIKRIKKANGIQIDINSINTEDKDVYDFYSKGRTVGVFQVSGRGMTNVLKKLKPTSLDDVATVIALYRPGPKQIIESYIRRKHGKEEITYFNPKMEKYLNLSYGLLVYQDDLLYTAIEVGGYNWGEIDVFRKAVGKKIPELMASEEQLFKEKCKKYSGLSNKEADYIWELFSPFVGYGFNKAHAYGYAKLSYQTAYLKYHYTGHYMAAILSSAENNIDRTNEMVKELNYLKIKILLPDVNKSENHYSVSKDEKNIRFGLYSIRNFGSGVSDAIIKERDKNGIFVNIEDFIRRMSPFKCINKKSLEALIKSGALSEIESAERLMPNLENILEYEKQKRYDDTIAQGTLFEETPLENNILLSKESIKINKSEKLFWEYEYLNAFVSDHPLMSIKTNISIQNIFDECKHADLIECPVFISSVKYKINKNNQKFAFITIEDTNESIEALCSSKVLQEYSDFISPLRIVIINGRVSIRDNEKSIIINGIRDIV